MPIVSRKSFDQWKVLKKTEMQHFYSIEDLSIFVILVCKWFDISAKTSQQRQRRKFRTDDLESGSKSCLSTLDGKVMLRNAWLVLKSAPAQPSFLSGSQNFGSAFESLRKVFLNWHFRASQQSECCPCIPATDSEFLIQHCDVQPGGEALIHFPHELQP